MGESGTIRRRVLVAGRVQGVFFRATCAWQATQRGVRGSVRNTGDGRVEAVFEGSEEQVGEMVSWSRQGPSGAVVEGIEVWAEPPEGIDGFRILG